MFPKRILLIINSNKYLKILHFSLNVLHWTNSAAPISLFLLQNTHKLFFKTQPPILSLFGLHTSILFSHKCYTQYRKGWYKFNFITLCKTMREYLNKAAQRRYSTGCWDKLTFNLFYLGAHNPMEIQVFLFGCPQ